MTRADVETVRRVESRDGTEIAYFSSGEGPPLVLVHGSLGDHTRWDALRPRLEAHFTVHAMDRRGRGASGDGPEYEPTREFEDVAAVVDAVAEDSGSAVDVLGSSAGALFSVGAAGMTSRIRRLALFEPPSEETISQLLGGGLPDRIDALLAAGDREGVLVTAYREVVGLSDAEIDHLRAQPEWPNRLAAAHTVPRELRIRPDAAFAATPTSSVTTPALVLVGSETLRPFRAGAENVAAALPRARLAVLEGQGHGAEVLAPEAVAEQLLPFLGQRDEGRGSSSRERR